VLGAAGGAVLNYGFSNYYRQCARHHFTLRALEVKYGSADVQREFGEAREAATAKAPGGGSS
jgi:hypothetical protein